MAQIETLGILQEIEALVSDQLKVVSYKWLSRNFLVSSNAAKQLLKEFVDKHGSGLEVLYTLSGWLKDSPKSYHIRIVSGSKLTDAKQDFDGNCSVQVYSVQASIPEDPASLWNTEYVQAEELFKQPQTFDNCLRDNRFCGISNTFVKRNVEGTSTSIAAPQPKSEAISGSSRHTFTSTTTAVSAPQKNKGQQYSPKGGPQSLNVAKDVKNEINSKAANEQSTKASGDKEKVPPLPANKKKRQNDNNSSGNGGSLANLWGCAAVKSKPISEPAYDNKSITDPTGNADSQIRFLEAVDNGDSDDDDAKDVNLKRASNVEDSRKRRLVLDYSDEEYEDAVSLASPDIAKGQSRLGIKGSPKPLISERLNSVLNKEKENELKVKEEMSTNSNQLHQDDSSVLRKSVKSNISYPEKIQSGASANEVNKEKPTEAANSSPKRRKVLKTRIDERGREVTEVIWESEKTDVKKVESDETKKADNNTMKKTENHKGSDGVNRAPAAKKSQAVGSTAPSNAGSKAGKKKAGNAKDPKQGNIFSFFKRV